MTNALAVVQKTNGTIENLKTIIIVGVVIAIVLIIFTLLSNKK